MPNVEWASTRAQKTLLVTKLAGGGGGRAALSERPLGHVQEVFYAAHAIAAPALLLLFAADWAADLRQGRDMMPCWPAAPAEGEPGLAGEAHE
jgi:hypothetical protein